MIHKTFLHWSSGKDAALALHLLQADPKFQVRQLITTINTDFDRVSMHGLRTSLLRKQAEHIGLPLMEIGLSGTTSMESYSNIMNETFKTLKAENFTHSAFGDILLEDLREFRDQNLDKIGMIGVYPLWKKDTHKLAEQIIDLGFKAITVTTSHKKLGRDFCGREFDHDFLAALPEGVDPCGENGEFHTFVYDGPIFSSPISFVKGETVLRDSAKAAKQKEEDDEQVNWETAFWYCDLI